MTLTREVKFEPSWDKTSEGYGIHYVSILFLLKGEEGVVQFKFGTNWCLPHMRAGLVDNIKRTMDKEYVWDMFITPQAMDLGYHSPKPKYREQPRYDCHLLPQGYCFYDGSTLNAEPLLEMLIEKGEEAVWAEMELYYHQVFAPRESGEEDEE